MGALDALMGVLGSASLCLAVAWPLGLLEYAVICLAVQVAAFIPAYALQTEAFYDLTGSLTFIIVIIRSYLASEQSRRHLVASLLVLVWTIRLGSFLVLRIHKVGKDSRFDHVKPRPLTFLQYWIVQGLWVFITSLPVLILSTKGSKQAAEFPSLLDRLGIAVWVLGFVVEVIADEQKARFNRSPRDRRTWIDVGLWSYSRHPNYLGEVMLWVGVLCLTSSTFDNKWDGLAVLSPTFVYLLLSRISIPMTEKGANKRWGEEPAYKAYLQRVPPLWPRLFS